MTNEQAKREIDSLDYYLQNHTDDYGEESHTAMMMAIKALEQEPCGKDINVPATDAISRQAVLDGVDRYIYKSQSTGTQDDFYSFAELVVKQLPSVTPRPKVGEWLEKEINNDNAIEEWQSARCSVCDKYHTTPYMYYFSHYDYCPHCGTKMEGRQKVDKRRSKRNR